MVCVAAGSFQGLRANWLCHGCDRAGDRGLSDVQRGDHAVRAHWLHCHLSGPADWCKHSAQHWTAQSLPFDLCFCSRSICLWLSVFALFGSHMKRVWSNYPPAGTVAFALLLSIGRRWRGVPEPGLWVAGRLRKSNWRASRPTKVSSASFILWRTRLAASS